MSDFYSVYRVHNGFNSNIKGILFIIWTGFYIYGCSYEDGQNTNGERTRDELDIRISNEWKWALEPSVDNLEFSGRMMVVATPKGNTSYASTTTVIADQYPRSIKIKLPDNEQISGTVSVALDTTSEATSISVDGWLRSKSLEGGYESYSDENPFSSAQLLFSTGRYQSNLEGTLNLKTFELYVIPNALPPYLFHHVDNSRFIVNLPPISEVQDINVTLWKDLDEGIHLSKAQVSIWKEGQLVSTLAESDAAGVARLGVWKEFLSQQNDLLEIRVQPAVDSGLPLIFKSLATEELETDTLELSFPHIGELIDIPLSIERNQTSSESDLNQVWTVWIQQTWGRVNERDYSLPNTLDQRRAAAKWQIAFPIRSTEFNEIRLYDTDGVMFIHPPPQSSHRTQRIEVSPLSSANSLRLSALPKAQVRGQLRDEEDRPVKAKVTLTQVAWPWVDAKVIPLGEFITQTDPQGGFSIAVDPGVYALTYLPQSKEYAPRVTLLRVPEGEGLVISPQQAMLMKGEEVSIRVGGDQGATVSIDSRLKLYCLISLQDEFFLGTSQRDKRRPSLKIPFYQTQLGLNETLHMKFDRQSCPTWPDNESDISL